MVHCLSLQLGRDDVNSKKLKTTWNFDIENIQFVTVNIKIDCPPTCKNIVSLTKFNFVALTLIITVVGMCVNH